MATQRIEVITGREARRRYSDEEKVGRKRYERTLFADGGLVLAGPRASASCGIA
jgi:hypothetical protein